MASVQSPDSAEMETMLKKFLSAQEELAAVESERDSALKALHKAEWQVYELEKEGIMKGNESFSEIVNLDTKFQSEYLLEDFRARLENLEKRDVSATTREAELLKSISNLTKNHSSNAVITNSEGQLTTITRDHEIAMKQYTDNTEEMKAEYENQIKALTIRTAYLEGQLTTISRDHEIAMKRYTDNSEEMKAEYENQIKALNIRTTYMEGQLTKMANEHSNELSLLSEKVVNLESLLATSSASETSLRKKIDDISSELNAEKSKHNDLLADSQKQVP